MSASRLVRLLCCGAALLCGPAFAQTPRVVQVSVVVESEQFTDVLDAAKLKKIGAMAAAVLATELAKPFPIIDWRVTAGADLPVAFLVGAVVERRTSTDPNVDAEIELVWRAKVNGNSFDLPRNLVKTLYRATVAARPVDDFKGQFSDALKVAITDWANSDSNQNILKSQFLKHVVLANKVVGASAEFVVVPLSFQGVKMSKNSVLLVKYQDGAANGSESKEFTLSGMVQRKSDPLPGGTQTHVTTCELGGRAVPAQENWAKCVGPLTANPTKTVSVYADPYIYDPNPDVDSGVIGQE